MESKLEIRRRVCGQAAKTRAGWKGWLRTELRGEQAARRQMRTEKQQVQRRDLNRDGKRETSTKEATGMLVTGLNSLEHRVEPRYHRNGCNELALKR